MTTKGSLTQRTLNAAKWGYLGAAGKLLIQLGSQVLLARLLGPADYGLFAVGAIVLGLSNYLADASIGSALVQRKDIDDELIYFVFTWQMVAGLTVTGVVFAFAGPIAGLLNKPEATELLRAMSVVCMITAVASTPSNLLRRRLDYKSLQISQLIGFTTGYVLVGVPMAFYGAGVWSLVTAWVVQATVTTGLVLRAARAPIGFRLWIPDGARTLRFGGNALLSNLSTWAGSNLDKVVVSRTFSAQELGVYHVVNNLLTTAVAQIISNLQQVIFSASSQVNASMDRMRQSFLITIEVGMLLMLPLFASMAIASKIVLIGLYGEQWREGVDLFEPLALATAMYGLSGLITPLLWASDNIRHESRIQIFSAIAIGLACMAAAQSGDILMVAWALFCVVMLRYLFIMVFTAKSFGIALGLLPRYLLPGLISTALCSLGVFAVSHFLNPKMDTAPAITFVIAAGMCGVIWMLAMVLSVRFASTPALWDVVQKVRDRRKNSSTEQQ